jgi:Flp pilus assembly pilin Flp
MFTGCSKAKLNEKGTTMLEYAITVALIAVVALASINNAGKAASKTINKAGRAIGHTVPLTIAGGPPAGTHGS